jgi:carbon-monoxide dehydrogenase medium subunit
LIAPAFEYRRPVTTGELLALLAKHRESARILAGGQGLIPRVKERRVRPSILLDLQRVEGLIGIELEDEDIVIGPQATHRDVAASSIVGSRCRLLGQVAARVGDPQVRNQGTLVGAVCEAAVAGDYPAMLLAYEAMVEVVGLQGTRRVRIEDFVRGAHETALESGEFVRAVRIPSAPHRVGAYCKVPLSCHGFALTGVAVTLRLDGERLGDVTIGITGATTVPFRPRELEGELRGKSASQRLIDQGVRNVLGDRKALSDSHGTATYRTALADVLARRALTRALREVAHAT